MPIEKIIHGNKTLAMVISGEPMEEGIQFYTPDANTLQAGKHCHSAGKIIKPHKHCPVKIERTGLLQEVLYIEEGKVNVTFYSDEGRKIDSKELVKGDMILLIEGGHGFEFLEKTRMIEIKEGPYIPESKRPLDVKDKR